MLRKSGFIPMLEEISAKKIEQEKAFDLIVDDSPKLKGDVKLPVGGDSASQKTSANIKVVQS